MVACSWAMAPNMASSSVSCAIILPDDSASRRASASSPRSERIAVPSSAPSTSTAGSESEYFACGGWSHEGAGKWLLAAISDTIVHV